MMRKLRAGAVAAILASTYAGVLTPAYASPTDYDSCVQSCFVAADMGIDYDRNFFITRCVNECERRWLGTDGNNPPTLPNPGIPGPGMPGKW